MHFSHEKIRINWSFIPSNSCSAMPRSMLLRSNKMSLCNFSFSISSSDTLKIGTNQSKLKTGKDDLSSELDENIKNLSNSTSNDLKSKRNPNRFNQNHEIDFRFNCTVDSSNLDIFNTKTEKRS